jgi:pyruvate-formate lyase-activating enzyme
MVRQYENPAIQQAHERVFKAGRSVPNSTLLPPGFSESQFQDLVEQLKAIVGVENVHTGGALLHFTDPFSPQAGNLPSAAAWYVMFVSSSF